MSIFGLFGKPNIEKLKAKRDVNGLIEALGYEKDEDIRKNAALALGDLDDSAAIDPLITALQDTYDVKVGVMQALAKMSHTRVLDYLMESLRNPNDRIQITAVEILNLKGWDPGMNEDGAFYWALRGNFRECLARGHLAVVPLIQLLNKEDFLIRRKEDLLSRRDIAETLGQIGDVRAVEPLIALLKYRNLSIDDIAMALGLIGDVRAVEPLIPLLKDGNSYLRQAVIVALGQIGDARAVTSLIPLLQDTNHNVRIDVVVALGQIGDAQAVEPLIPLLKDYASKSIPHHLDKRVCDFVADTLRIIGTLEAQNALLNAGFDIA